MILILIYCNIERQWNASTFPHWIFHCIPESNVGLRHLFLVKNSSAENFCLSLLENIYKMFQNPKFGLQRLNMWGDAWNRSIF